jgi:hypothetical protein
MSIYLLVLEFSFPILMKYFARMWARRMPMPRFFAVFVSLFDQCLDSDMHQPLSSKLIHHLWFIHVILLHTECPRRNVPNFGSVFLMLKYNDISQNTYIQSWTVTEIMAREKCGLLAVPRIVPAQLTCHPYVAHARPWEFRCCQLSTVLWTVSYLYGDVLQYEREVVHM